MQPSSSLLPPMNSNLHFPARAQTGLKSNLVGTKTIPFFSADDPPYPVSCHEKEARPR